MESIKQILIALDQLLNAIFRGWADETLSARAYRLAPNSIKWRTVQQVIDAAFFWDEAHCFASYQSEQKRLQLPPEYRKGKQQ